MSGFVCGFNGDLPFLTARDKRRNSYCCYGSCEYGPTGCTCWEPVFDLVQVAAIPAKPVTRRTRCVDCAFRPDSPERARGDEVEDLPHFWCHQGIRRPAAFRHPDGRVRKVSDSADYQPPIIDGVPYRADGTPADRCAGWAQTQRVLRR